MIHWLYGNEDGTDTVIEGDPASVMDADWAVGERESATEAASRGDIWVYIDPYARDVYEERLIRWALTREAATDDRAQRADDI